MDGSAAKARDLAGGPAGGHGPRVEEHRVPAAPNVGEMCPGTSSMPTTIRPDQPKTGATER